MNPQTAVIPFLILLAGCGGPTAYKPTPIPEEPPVDAAALTPTSILKLIPGSKALFTMQTQSNPAGLVTPLTGDLAFTITDVQTVANGQKISVELKVGDKVSDLQTWLLNDKGLYQLTAGTKNVPFVPMQPLVLFPVKDGQDFRWKGKGLCPDGVVGDMQSTSHVLGSQSVDTAIGKQAGVAIITVTSYQHGKAKGLLQNTNWFKPNVGIIRLKQTLAVPRGSVETTLALKAKP